MSRKIYVGNIPFNVTEQDIRDLFSEYGEIKSIKMIMDKYTGNFRGFCFVEMEKRDNAKKAISELSGKTFKGKELKVAEAKPQQSRYGFQDTRVSFGRGRGARRR